jgi:hypothetical protein
MKLKVQALKRNAGRFPADFMFQTHFAVSISVKTPSISA